MNTNSNKNYIIGAVVVVALILFFVWSGKKDVMEEPIIEEEETEIVSETPTTPEVNRPVSPAVAATRVLLATRLNIPIAQVTFVSETPKNWPDSCLGISSPGVMCAQVITPGSEIKLSAGGIEYTYRSNQNGSLVKATN